MAPRGTGDERDPHLERIIFDTTEWHDRLERLVELRRELPTSTFRSHGGKAIAAVMPAGERGGT
jgi:hypothetical protein